MGGPRCPRDRRHLQMLAHARDRRPASSATLSGKQSAKTRSQHRSFAASGDSDSVRTAGRSADRAARQVAASGATAAAPTSVRAHAKAPGESGSAGGAAVKGTPARWS